jgi:hypothetical protein
MPFGGRPHIIAGFIPAIYEHRRKPLETTVFMDGRTKSGHVRELAMRATLLD